MHMYDSLLLVKRWMQVYTMTSIAPPPRKVMAYGEVRKQTNSQPCPNSLTQHQTPPPTDISLNVLLKEWLSMNSACTTVGHGINSNKYVFWALIYTSEIGTKTGHWPRVWPAVSRALCTYFSCSLGLIAEGRRYLCQDSKGISKIYNAETNKYLKDSS